MGTRLRSFAVLLAVVTVAAACGSRLPDQTLKAIDADLVGDRAAGGTQVAAGPGTAETSTDAAAPTAAGPEAAPTAGPAPAGGAPTGAAATAATAPTACRAGSATSVGVTPREIKAASIVTDSGPLPGATEGSYRGAAAYFAMINSQGGVCGRKLTLLKGDDGLDPGRARGEFLRLEPQVLSIVGAFSVADSGYMDLIEKTKVPYASLTVDPSGRHLATVWPKRTEDKVSTGPYVWLRKQHPEIKKAAVLYADIGAVKANLEGTVKAIEKAGFQLAMPPTAVGVADPDYTGTVRNLQDKGVDFVYLFSFEVNMHVRFNRNMKQQHYEPKLKVANIAFNDRFSQLLKADGDGWENTNAYLPFLDPAEKGRSKAVNDFVTWNQRLFPGQQMDLFNVSGWGAAAYFVEALRTAGGDVNRASLLAALAKVPKYDDGGVGVPFDPHTGEPTRCFTMAKHVNGAWKREYPASGLECNLGEILKYK